MKAVYQELLDNSLGAALSAIEIYNKPDFKYRDETFVILIINAWELLMKAKILKDNNHKKSSLYIKDGLKYKKSRTGNYLTVEIKGAMSKLELNDILIDNIESILEIRDTAIHFYNKDTIAYTIFTLGAATLQNYQKLVKEWFDKDLTQFNFYILPLGFKYSFKNFELMELDKEPEAISNLIRLITSKQISKKTESNGYYLVADIKAEVVSAKKISKDADVTIGIDNSSNAKGIVRTQKITDKYPLTATEIFEAVGGQCPGAKQNEVWSILKNIKGNEKYSAYNFSSKKKEKEYREGKAKPPQTVVYNEETILYVLDKIPK